MYVSYWGLTTPPFDRNSDPRSFFGGSVHEEARARLEYLVERGCRGGLLTGPPGTGKTYLLETIVRERRWSRPQPVAIDANGLDGEELIRQLACGLGPAPRSNLPLGRLRADVGDRLGGLAASGRRVLVSIDDAHRAGERIVDELRSLFALDARTGRVLTVIFATDAAGHASLAGWREFFDLRIELRPLDRAETARYVEHRLSAAGGTRGAFDATALDAVFDRTGGIPRKVDRLCDLALLAGMMERAAAVTAEIVETAAVELLPATAESASTFVSA